MAAVTTTRDRLVRDRLVKEFETLERQGTLRDPSWLAPRRRAALARFAEAGFPTTRDEAWRYTNLAPLVETPFHRAAAVGRAALPPATIERLTLGEAGGPRLVFVDGRYSARDSSSEGLPDGVQLSSLAEAMADHGELVERHLARHAGSDANVFADLSTAFVEDGAFLHLPADRSVGTPIEILCLATVPGVLAQPRILVVVGPQSRVTVVERYVGLIDDAYFTNAVTEIVAAQGATIDHYTLQEQGEGAFHVATVHAALERDSALSTCGATFGGRLSRTTLTLRFAGEGGRGTLRGLYVVGGHQLVDHHVTVDHAVPRCSSRQLYKGVLDGSARAVFNGRVVVRPDAQKTDANQTNKHLLLSDGVEVDSKPQLEIFADDVKCTHGAAEGQLAPESIFYLRSRGLDEPAARALLTLGFAREVVDGIEAEAIRMHLDRVLGARLATVRARKES
jgi:Fe-S cluster assembly protein SufD